MVATLVAQNLMAASFRRANKRMRYLIEEFWAQSVVNVGPALSSEAEARVIPPLNVEEGTP